MGDFKKIFKTLKDLLVSEDSLATKRVIDLQEGHEQILREELQSAPKVNISKLSKDTLGTSLIPEEQRGLRVVKVSGDGNCLYNSASIFIKGDETLNGTLRVLTACELYLNAEFYANHAKIYQASGDSSHSEKTLFTLMLTAAGENEWQVSSSKVEAVKAEAAGTSEDKVWSGLVHLMGLATVIKRPIFSVYPNANLALRPLMHGLIHPRLCSPADVSPVHIMWSRDGNLDNRPGAIFQPHHFVPLVCGDDSEMPSVTKSSQVEKVPLITQFFSRKPDLTCEVQLGTKRLAKTIVSRGDWLGNPANFKGTFCCFGFDVETYHHVTMTLHSLFQSKMADGADFLNGDDLEAILDILEAGKEMEEEFINEDENVSTRNTIITYYFGEREGKMTRKPEHLNTNV